jgi:hypothetical protein
VGNEQLAGIRDNAAVFHKRIAEWSKTKALVDARKPIWELVGRLARHAQSIPGAADSLEQVEAVRAQRLLLAPTDPVSPLRSALADAVRKAVLDAHAALEQAYSKGITSLDVNASWHRLAGPDRAGILASVGLSPVAALELSTDDALLSALDARSLSAREAETDAVPGRVQKALEQAARLLEPKVRSIAIERSTLATPADVDAWTERQKKTLVEAIKDGPVLVS